MAWAVAEGIWLVFTIAWIGHRIIVLFDRRGS